jgi:hypothetical protein
MGATHVLATPVVWQATGPKSDHEVPNLRVIALGGEPTPLAVIESWWDSPALFANTYGVTECCVYQAFSSLNQSPFPTDAGPAPPTCAPRLLGGALEGTVLILASGKGDDPMKQVEEASGRIGELWIAGKQVGLGYLKRPELTLERFLEHPVLGRCFRTGDMVAATAAGWEFRGRRDCQVKIRGRRVELAEIEEALMKAGASKLVRAICVVPHEGSLIAWCVRISAAEALEANPPGVVTEDPILSEALRLLGEDRLPRLMVPARFLCISDLPHTATGKIARKELVAHELPSLACRHGDAPNTGLEKVIAETWSAELGVSLPGREAHFPALGGDSMAALRVCLRLRHSLLSGRIDNAEGDAAGGLPADQTGTFGELMGPLAPAELLQRPRLMDFARHLQNSFPDSGIAELGAIEEAASTTEESNNDIVGIAVEDASIMGPEGDDPWCTLLRRAASAGSEDVSQVALTHCADLSISSDKGPTPLHLACLNGHSAIASTLLEAQASPATQDRSGRTPLHFSAQRCPVDVAQSLLMSRASLAAKDLNQQTALHHCARAGGSLATLDLFLAPPPAKDSQGRKGKKTSLREL